MGGEERVYIPNVTGPVLEDEHSEYADKVLRKLNIVAVYPHFPFIQSYRQPVYKVRY